MRMSLNRPTLRRRAAAGGIVALAAMVAACGGRTTGDVTSLLMGPSGTERQEIASERPDQSGVRCPRVSIRDGTETLRVYEQGFEGDPERLRHQGSVNEVVRECDIAPDGSMELRIGVAGRLITGPVGSAGDFELPVRAAVVRRGGDSVWSELVRVPATVQPGDTSVRFRHVTETIAVELPEGDAPGHYIIYVGFDELS